MDSKIDKVLYFHFRIIVYPFSNPPSRKMLLLIITSIWLCAFATAGPAFYMHEYEYTIAFRQFECKQKYHRLGPPYFVARMNYLWTIGVISLILPLIFLVFLYGASIQHLEHRPRSASTASWEIQQRGNQKVRRMFTLLVCVFIVLAGPNSCILMANSYMSLNKMKIDMEKSAYRVLNIVFYCLYLLSAVINPWIYVGMHKEVRKGMSEFYDRVSKLSMRSRTIDTQRKARLDSTSTNMSATSQESKEVCSDEMKLKSITNTHNDNRTLSPTKADTGEDTKL